MTGVVWDEPAAKRIGAAVRKIEKIEPPKLRQQAQSNREASTFIQWFRASKLLYNGITDDAAALVHKGTPTDATDWDADEGSPTATVYADCSTQGIFIAGDVFACIYMDGWRPISPGNPNILVKSGSAITKGNSGTLTIYSGTLGSETTTGVTISAYSRLGDVGASKWAHVAMANGRPEVVNAEC